ncbi:MAG TPA: FimV/HubP family polar landmark protein [Burkholderiaceae bacterium]|nr:FimV/HubP family polar landmark protein [Burkholderiaceae bacterium]
MGLGDALKNTTQQLGRFALSSVAVAALSLGAVNAWALGLGRLSVQSSLGETLRAEIDVTSLTPEEAGNLKIRIAAPDTYRASGVDYNVVLPSTQATLLKRADGRPFLRLTSDRVVQEPFVDVILELSWSTGRLVREYTLLFDPPTDRPQAAASAPPSAVATAPVISAPAPAPRPARAAAPAAPVAQAPAPAPERAATPAATPAAPSEPVGDTYRVRSGDTLTGIASRTRRGSVSLDQTLVSLYRGNPKAFVGENMNRLKAGALLSVPSAEAAAAVDAAEARQLIQAQSADFGSFRQRLASGVPAVQADVPARKDAGTVQASVDDRKTTNAVAPDKLTLSKGASAAKPGAPEVKISKDKEKQDAAVRVAELSKNVEELKKLSGATNANGGTPAAAAPPAPAPAASVAPAPATAPVVASMPAEPPATVVAEEKKAAAAASASKPAPAKAAAPQEAEEPGFLSELFEGNALMLGVGGGAILALLGFGVYRARRAKLDTGETSFLESRLQPDSFFGASGGQRIDTREAASGAPSSMSYSLSQLDAIGDVDPVAEADVYLAYGRDLQAEEILKEAMRSSPERMAIRTKLLEVYAKRRDTKGFELLATQLFALTGGSGEDWEKAQELGLDIDPDNTLYQPGGSPDSMSASDSGLMSEPLGASTMPQSVLPTQSSFNETPTEVLGNASEGAAEEIDFDLDLDALESAPAAVAPPSPPPLESFDFEPSPTPSAAQAFYPSAAAPGPDSKSPLEFDMSSISLDLDAPAAPASAGATDIEIETDGVVDDEADDDNADPLARKLELAEEFRQIGDTEGARDLLQEVANKAEGTLKAKAQGMLADLD